MSRRVAPRAAAYSDGTGPEGGAQGKAVAPIPPTRFGATVQAKPAAVSIPPTRFGATVQAKPAAVSIPPTRYAPAAGVQRMELENYGGGQSKKIFGLPSGWKKKIKKKSAKKIDKMFISGDQVSTARSYDGQRVKQALRWVSSLVFKAFPTGVEIQSYFYNGKIYISSNKTSVNKSIKLAVSGGLLGALKKMHDDEFTSFDDDFQERITDHGRKLLSDTIYDSQKPLWDAIENSKVVVPEENYSVDLHAERRIRKHLGVALDFSKLGGVKRPCTVCTIDLDFIDEANSGPFWPSKSALGGYTQDDVKDQMVDDDIFSFVTLSKRNKKKTVDYDSDSDSSASSYEDDSAYESD